MTKVGNATKEFFIAIWDEVSFVYAELKKTFSNEPSYFSSKRIERALLFLSALAMANRWFWTHVSNLGYAEAIAYWSALLAFAGYTMHQTQKEKKDNKKL